MFTGKVFRSFFSDEFSLGNGLENAHTNKTSTAVRSFCDSTKIITSAGVLGKTIHHSRTENKEKKVPVVNKLSEPMVELYFFKNLHEIQNAITKVNEPK